MCHILLLFCRQVQDLLLTGGTVLQCVPLDIQVLPTNQGFDRSHLQCPQRVLYAKAVLSSVLGDLVKVPTYQLLLLNELHIGEGLSRELDGLEIMDQLVWLEKNIIGRLEKRKKKKEKKFL